jgi:hypothetical protein
MNTKLFFLLIAALLISNTTSSLVISKKQTASIEVRSNTEEVTAGNDQLAQMDIPPTNQIHQENGPGKKVHKPNSEEDGKHHHFHFGRITARNGRKVLILFISKLVLTIAHIACFIYCFQHVFH